MSFLLLKSKKTLAIISGILFIGLLINTFAEKVPIELVEASQTDNISATITTATESNINENITVSEVEKIPEYTPDADKVNRIKTYLAKRNAPLAEYAEEFVRAADTYGIDYRLAASISVIESGGGKDCFKSYNAWGWGKKHFANWKEGIWTVSEGLSKYYAKGLNTPKLISTYYCPPTANIWASKVQFVMNEIAK